MLPYLMYKALADERQRDLRAAVRRHDLTAAATRDSGDRTEREARLKDLTAWIVALFNGRRGARARPTVTSASGAGPIGCSA